jgi:RNA polymerase sigma factor for flagellar operon FliA
MMATTESQALALDQGMVLVGRVARRMSRQLWHHPPASDLACLGMLTLCDAARRHDPARATFTPYLTLRLRWAMISDARRAARRERLLAATGETRPVHKGCAPCDARDDEDQAEPEARAATDPEAAVDEQRRCALVRRALAEVPREMRLVLVRHYYGGERFDALARELGLSKAKVTRLHRAAIRLLASKLKDAR